MFLPQRARPSGATAGHALASDGELGPVENQDTVSALLHLAASAPFRAPHYRERLPNLVRRL